MLESVLSRFSEQLDFLLPPGMRSLRHDIDKLLKSTLQDALGGLDMVTREDFNAATALSQSLRQNVADLEGRLKSAESRLRQLEERAGRS